MSFFNQDSGRFVICFDKEQISTDITCFRYPTHKQVQHMYNTTVDYHRPQVYHVLLVATLSLFPSLSATFAAPWNNAYSQLLINAPNGTKTH